MSVNCTRHNHQHSPHITSPQVTAADPLRKRIESPTAVHEFADEASVVTETSSDGSSLELWLAPHDAISIPSSREEEDEEEAYHDYFTRMSRLIEKAHPVRGTNGSIVQDMEVQPTTNDAPIAETTTADGIPMERQHPEDGSKCCQLYSQCCGMTDDPLHETLFPSPEWFCCQRLDEERHMDPIPMLDESSAAILIQSKWRSFIAVKHYASTRSSVLVFYELGPSQQVVMEEEAEATLAQCAIVIQSRWRAHAASRRYARMLTAIRVLQSLVRRVFAVQQWRRIRRDVTHPQEGIRDILLEDKRERAATLFQSIVRRRLVLQKIENARQFHGQVHPPVVVVGFAAESAVIKCQSAIRRWMVVRQMREWRGSTRCSYPNKMHVAQTGHIELILNDTSETADETFTAYSEVSHASWEEEEEEEEVEDETEEEVDEDETSCCLSKTDNCEAPFEQSRCGLSDNVHEMLIQSGKWIYDRVGDPNVDTAHDLLTIMEISEEVVFCCGARPCCK